MGPLKTETRLSHPEVSGSEICLQLGFASTELAERGGRGTGQRPGRGHALHQIAEWDVC